MPAVAAFVVALVVRLVFCVQASKSPFMGVRLIDEQDYHNLAEGFLHGSWPGHEALFRPPLYPLFLSALYRAAGDDVWTVRIVQAGFGALSAPLTAWIAGKAFRSPPAALAAGLVVALSGPLVYYDAQLLAASLDVVLVLATVACLLRASSTWRARDWLLAGAVAGLAATNRGSMLLVVPLAAGWAFATRDCALASGRVRRGMASLAAGALLAVAPLAWHNARNDDRPEASYTHVGPVTSSATASVGATLLRIVRGRYCPLGWADGINLYIGNQPDLVAVNRDADVAHFEWFNALNDEPWRAGATTAHEHSDWFKKKLRDCVLGNFGRWVGLTVHKVFEVVNGYEPPRGTNPYAERESSSLLRLLLWSGPLKLPTGALLPLAFVAAWALRREPGAQLLGLVMVTQLAFVVAFFVTSRYRLPALPLAAILATELASRAIRSLRVKAVPTKEGLVAGASAVVLLLVCNWPLAGEIFGRSAIEEYDLGDELAHAGKQDEAVRHLRASLAIAPGFADAHVYLGAIWFSQGRVDDAIAEYRAALDLDPGNALARKNLDDALAHEQQQPSL